MDAQARKQQLETLLALAPDDPELHYAIGMESVSVGDDAGAAVHFQRLMELSPKYPPAYHMAGRTLLRLNRDAEAKAVLERGIPVAMSVGNQHAAGEMQELLDGIET